MGCSKQQDRPKSKGMRACEREAGEKWNPAMISRIRQKRQVITTSSSTVSRLGDKGPSKKHTSPPNAIDSHTQRICSREELQLTFFSAFQWYACSYVHSQIQASASMLPASTQADHRAKSKKERWGWRFEGRVSHPHCDWGRIGSC